VSGHACPGGLVLSLFQACPGQLFLQGVHPALGVVVEEPVQCDLDVERDQVIPTHGGVRGASGTLTDRLLLLAPSERQSLGLRVARGTVADGEAAAVGSMVGSGVGSTVGDTSGVGVGCGRAVEVGRSVGDGVAATSVGDGRAAVGVTAAAVVVGTGETAATATDEVEMTSVSGGGARLAQAAAKMVSPTIRCRRCLNSP